MNNLNFEMLLEFFKKNYLYLIFGLILVMSGIASYFFYITSIKEKIYSSQEAYENFLSELALFDGLEFTELEAKLEEVKNAYDQSIYYHLANFHQAKIYFENGQELKAMSLMEQLNADLEQDKSSRSFLRDISRIRLASIYIDFDRFEDAKELLDRNFDFFDSLKLEKLGDIEKVKFNNEGAKNYYKLAIETSQNQTQINLLNFKLSSLASSNDE
ncbi:MAG: tetratricopeptide repeat protein [Gammaproteobacteria bacterium]|nr:MAG: tetratricopeptide repeat protein [Gammaproteobacteria bacterium]|tara:strand:- start:293 stop:937 length:645 start_codon:yes stop_codon:yes gene_type:complete